MLASNSPRVVCVRTPVAANSLLLALSWWIRLGFTRRAIDHGQLLSIYKEPLKGAKAY